MSLAWVDTESTHEIDEGAALLSEKDVSQMTGVSAGTLHQLHLAGIGPSYTTSKDGVRFYSPEAVSAWQAERSTAHKALMASYGAAQ